MNFNETYTLNIKQMIILKMVEMASKRKWVVKQLDVHLTFLNDNLIQEIYMNQPKGFEVKGV
jgi:hypothetical protein